MPPPLSAWVSLQQLLDNAHKGIGFFHWESRENKTDVSSENPIPRFSKMKRQSHSTCPSVCQCFFDFLSLSSSSLEEFVGLCLCKHLVDCPLIPLSGSPGRCLSITTNPLVHWSPGTMAIKASRRQELPCDRLTASTGKRLKNRS